MTRSRYLVHSLGHHLELMHTVDRRVRSVQQSLAQAQMIDAFSNIALEHMLSAPVISTMRAAPGFDDAVKNFPDSALFSIVPEHRSSAKQEMGLESFAGSQSDTGARIRESAQLVVTALGDVFTGLSDVANDFKSQLADNKATIEATELPDPAISSLPVFTLSDEGFSQTFMHVENHLSAVEAFNVDELRANPEKIRSSIDGLSAIVSELGQVLGMEMTASGLTDADKSEDFVPTQGTIQSKGLNKEQILYFTDRADGLCDQLNSIGEKSDDLITALNTAVQEIPDTLNSDDVTYGANEHVTLFSCYATLVTKLLRESVVLVSRVLTTSDAVVDEHAVVVSTPEAELNESGGGAAG